MNFFENQKKARRNTILLVFLYLLAVVLIVISVYAGILIVLIQGDPELVKFDINTFFRNGLREQLAMEPLRTGTTFPPPYPSLFLSVSHDSVSLSPHIRFSLY